MEKETYVQRSTKSWDSIESIVHGRNRSLKLEIELQSTEKSIKNTDRRIGKMVKDLLKKMEG